MNGTAVRTHLASRVVPGKMDALERERFSTGHVVGCHDETESLGRGQVEPRIVQVEDQLPPRQVGHLQQHTARHKYSITNYVGLSPAV